MRFTRLLHLAFIAATSFLLASIALASEPLPTGASYDVGFSPSGDSLNVVLKGSVGLLRDGTEALVGVMAMVTGGIGDETNIPMQ